MSASFHILTSLCRAHNFRYPIRYYISDIPCTMTSSQLWSKETLPPGRVSYWLCSLIKNPEEEDPPWRTTPKLINFGDGSSGRVLFLRVTSFRFGNHPTKKPPQGGGFLLIHFRDSIQYVELILETLFTMSSSLQILNSLRRAHFW